MASATSSKKITLSIIQPQVHTFTYAHADTHTQTHTHYYTLKSTFLTDMELHGNIYLMLKVGMRAMSL